MIFRVVIIWLFREAKANINAEVDFFCLVECKAKAFCSHLLGSKNSSCNSVLNLFG